ncbi:YkvA family protein [Bacillus suaedaesalsae]|uniref:DUF1232 domain-containing protein n=1 Tax=Bacillus suaedaesalsae TaxID=2810349 RepID=A0ABS2DHY0_9BACI|nr:YkvA family protein [Bacillus suaedaesalsae]MBM6618097.1 DUF1232 domain-containing protein [Bacillus suaedaesalsae]
MEFNDRKALVGIGRFRNKAVEYIKDRKKATELLKQVQKKTTLEHSRIGTFKNQLFLLIDLYHDWHSGNYRQLPFKTLTMVIAAILYFVVPTDMIPDIFLGAGFIDDAAVLALILKQISNELEKYKVWKDKQTITTDQEIL